MKPIFQFVCVAFLLSSQAFCAVISVSWATEDLGASQNWITTLPSRGEELNPSILDGEAFPSFNPNDSLGHQDFLDLIHGMMDITPISSDLGRSGPGLYDLVPPSEPQNPSIPTATFDLVAGHGSSVPEPSTFLSIFVAGFGVLVRRSRLRC